MTGFLAIIPARGGSKGIPRKNLAPLGGKPLVAHSIGHALACFTIGRVIVSTDDEEVAEVSRRWGAEVVMRPGEISGDDATSESVLLHVLDSIAAKGEEEPEAVVFLQATSPLRRPDDLSKALETFVREEADSLFSACPFHGFVWRKKGSDFESLTYDHLSRKRRQECPEDVLENGSIYVVKPRVLRQTGNRLGGRIAVHIMDPLDSIQADEPGDLELMEALLSLRGAAGAETDGSPFLELASLARENAARMDGLVEAAGKVVAGCLRSGGKVLACGNGGSAADAQHFVAELVGRLARERAPWPAIALAGNPSVVTAIANDYGFESVFARQVEALGTKGDVLVAVTTSGTSPNVIRAAEIAKGKGMSVVALTGAAGNTPLSGADVFIPVPGGNTQRIQEMHIAVLHALCDRVETRLTGEAPAPDGPGIDGGDK